MSSVTHSGHVIYVKKQNYIPVFLAPQPHRISSSSSENSPRNSSNSSPPISSTENGVCEETACENYANESCEDVFVDESCSYSQDFASSSRLSAPPDFFLEHLHNSSIQNGFSTGTTRTLSSRFSVRYSSNISKMKPQTDVQCFCDGYFGCPDEEEKRKCKGKKKKICMNIDGNPSVPWLRRLQKISWYKSKENTNNNTSSCLQPYNPINSSTNTLTRGCTINYMDRTRQSSETLLSSVNQLSNDKDKQCPCSKTHSSTFCNYCFESTAGSSHNHLKRWSCDGYFGCPDETHERKRKGKKKPCASVNSLADSVSSQSMLRRFLSSRSSIRSTDISQAPQENTQQQQQQQQQQSPPTVTTTATVIITASKKVNQNMK